MNTMNTLKFGFSKNYSGVLENIRIVFNSYTLIYFLGFTVLIFLFFSVPFSTHAQTVKTTKPKAALKAPLEISGWIPYWRMATGTADATRHIDAFKEISPFGYTVKNDGELYDAMKIGSDEWQKLIQTARDKKVKVIPSIMWSNAESIDKILRNPKLRKAHIGEIVKMLKTNNFDGVDIDYEGKKAETKKYFSLFLKELYKAVGKKLVVCSIEPRTPLNSRFDKIPKDIQYANDFKEINKYCDRVRIMTYDQGMSDLRLNETAGGLYNPIADTRWVEKVITLASNDISKKKIVIGIPTYGHEYKVKPMAKGYEYDFLWSFNPKYALDLMSEYGLTATRNQAGELSFTYIPRNTPTANNQNESSEQTNGVPIATTSISTAILPNALSQGFNLVWWSDAKAIRDKVLLAKKMGVRGVAIFKIDGGEDPDAWDAIR